MGYVSPDMGRYLGILCSSRSFMFSRGEQGRSGLYGFVPRGAFLSIWPTSGPAVADTISIIKGSIPLYILSDISLTSFLINLRPFLHAFLQCAVIFGCILLRFFFVYLKCGHQYCRQAIQDGYEHTGQEYHAQRT